MHIIQKYLNYILDRFPLELGEQLVIYMFRNFTRDPNFEPASRFDIGIIPKTKIQIIFGLINTTMVPRVSGTIHVRKSAKIRSRIGFFGFSGPKRSESMIIT